VLPSKVRPQDRGKIKLCISDVPQEEVADALFAAGSDQEFGFGEVFSPEVGFEGGFGEGVGVEEALLGGPGNEASCMQDFLAAAVAKGEGKSKAGTAGRASYSLTEALYQRTGKHRFPGADNMEANVILNETLFFLVEHEVEQLHEGRDLILGALPVFRGKGIQREEGDTEFGRGFYGVPHGPHGRTVAFYAGKAPRLRPSPISIHDNSHMGR